LEFRVLVFVEGEKPGNLEKKPSDKARTNSELNPHMGTLVESECSHHCPMPAPQAWGLNVK